MSRRKPESPEKIARPPDDVVPPATRGRRPSSLPRAIAFRLLALSSPLLLLWTVNLALYFFGVGFDTRVVIPLTSAGNQHTYNFNEFSSQAYFDDRELAGPDPQPFQLPRPDDVYRVVVIGASTVEGFPYYTELAFPRQVEIFLREQLPDRRIEVLNAGIVGINSFALADFVPRMLVCSPDLVVVYTGHNEFYGPGGVGSTATLSPALYPALTQLRRWRLYQWLRQTFRPKRPRQLLVAALPRDLQISLFGAQFRRAESYYREHLIDIATAAERRRVPILFCSVVSNLGDQSPVQSISDPRLTPDQVRARDRLLAQARDALDHNQPEAALELVDQAAELDEGYALMAYRRAECLLAAGQRDAALTEYKQARDLDGCRFRAPGSFRDIVRQVATAPERTGCYFLDLEPVLEGLSKTGIPGHDFFFEHVHFNFDGNREVARAIARCILENVLNVAWTEDRVPTDDAIAQSVGLTTFDHLTALGHALTILHNSPFKNAPDQKRQVAYLTRQMNTYLRSLPRDDQIMFAELDTNLRQTDMINALAAALIKLGNIPRALEMFEIAQRRRPWEITSYVGAAKCQMALGNRREALTSVERALQLAPDDQDLLQIHRELAQ